MPPLTNCATWKFRMSPTFVVCQFQICQKLSLVNREDVLNAFEFKNNCVVDDQVDPITTIKADILIPDGEWHLALERKITEM